jgi:hypothetical protein
MEIELPPNGWRPRAHQRNLWRYFKGSDGKTFDGTDKRAVEIAHRRWGKDEIAMQLAAQAGVVRPATYWHMLPEYEQARKAIWTSVNPHTGIRRIDEMFPAEWRSNLDDRGMFIRFKWGATWQVVGSDNFRSLVGTPPAGIVLSEWSKAHPGAWAYLAPILAENHGWGLFITTPEGRNHAQKTYELGRSDASWFSELQTIEDSIRLCQAAGEPPPMTLDMVEQQRKEYHGIYGTDAGDAMIQQEFWCSWSAAILGAYWGRQIEAAEHAGRICELSVIPGLPVHRAWDIGIDDPMAIWCYQIGPGWLHIVDYIEGSGYGFDWYAGELRKRGYLEDKRGTDRVPHDAKQREPGAKGRTRIESMVAEGLNPLLVPDHKPIDRVNAGRRLIAMPHVYFDETRCAQGLECLRNFKAKWDPINRTFQKQATHDWASHGSDAWGHLCVAVEFPIKKPEPEKFKGVVPRPLTVNDLLKASKPARKWE